MLGQDLWLASLAIKWPITGQLAIPGRAEQNNLWQ